MISLGGCQLQTFELSYSYTDRVVSGKAVFEEPQQWTNKFNEELELIFEDKIFNIHVTGLVIDEKCKVTELQFLGGLTLGNNKNPYQIDQ